MGTPAGRLLGTSLAKLRKNVVVLDRESDITSGAANSRLSEGSVADAEHTELSGQTIQV